MGNTSLGKYQSRVKPVLGNTNLGKYQSWEISVLIWLLVISTKFSKEIMGFSGENSYFLTDVELTGPDAYPLKYTFRYKISNYLKWKSFCPFLSQFASQLATSASSSCGWCKSCAQLFLGPLKNPFLEKILIPFLTMFR